jgi:hypothetical protein
MAAQLFSFYPRNEANDPESFIAGATAMLARYPEAVVEAVCNPARGLPANNKFLPSIAEIRAACEQEAVWHDAVTRREARRAETARVLGDVRAPAGSAEHPRVLKRFRDLGALLNAKNAENRRPAASAARTAWADKPMIVTQDMAAYLGRWLEPEQQA